MPAGSAKRFFEQSPSGTALLLANALVTVLALVLDWGLGDLMWPFYLQSLIIGWFARKRMLALQRFSTEGFSSNGQRVPEDEIGKRGTVDVGRIDRGPFPGKGGGDGLPDPRPCGCNHRDFSLEPAGHCHASLRFLIKCRISRSAWRSIRSIP